MMDGWLDGRMDRDIAIGKLVFYSCCFLFSLVLDTLYIYYERFDLWKNRVLSLYNYTQTEVSEIRRRKKTPAKTKVLLKNFMNVNVKCTYEFRFVSFNRKQLWWFDYDNEYSSENPKKTKKKRRKMQNNRICSVERNKINRM